MVLEQTYYAVHINHITESWGGVNYNKILVKDYMNADLVSTVSTAATTASFLYPELIKNSYYLDGRASGHFTLHNAHASETSTVSAYTVSLLKTADVPSATVTLGSFSNTITADNTIVAHDFLVLPIAMDISHDDAEIGAGEKLILKIEITATSGGTLEICHSNFSDDESIKITLPIVYGNQSYG